MLRDRKGEVGKCYSCDKFGTPRGPQSVVGGLQSGFNVGGADYLQE